MKKNINVTRSSMPEFQEYCDEIRELWDSCWLTNMGAKHLQLEQDLKNYLHTPNVTLFANGHLALENVLAAFDFPKGAEVITTPFTFVSTTNAIVRCGLRPVFCDINPVDYTLDVTKIEALITEKTVAILPVHVYGNLCDTVAMDAIAQKHGLKVIYDAAHAFGVSKNGVSTANFGDASMFSFHATKVFHTIEGGAVTYREESLSRKLDQWKNFGIRDGENVDYPGGNAKMNEFAASMGICNLRHLDEEIAKRKLVSDRYQARLENIPGICLCQPQEGVASNYAYFPVVFDSYKETRDQVQKKLIAEGVLARRYFYPLTSTFKCYDFDPEPTPVATRISNQVLCLPLYADLTLEDVDYICDVILK